MRQDIILVITESGMWWRMNHEKKIQEMRAELGPHKLVSATTTEVLGNVLTTLVVEFGE